MDQAPTGIAPLRQGCGSHPARLTLPRPKILPTPMQPRPRARHLGPLSLSLRGALLAILVPLAPAQTFKLAEDFDGLAPPAAGQQGPAALIQRGWIFRNQSTPLAAAAFRPGASPGWPHSTAGFLLASSDAAGQFGAQVSSWAILPTVPGQAAGDLLTVQVLDGGYPSADTYFEVRYSPSGATGTGSGPSAIGDFTTLLFTGELPLSAQYVYNEVAVELPGPGRVALRYRVPAISNFMSVASLYLDTLTVGGSQPPACGLELPQTGETVTWSAAGSPYTVCQPLLVPTGATLVLGPGVTVQFEHGKELLVEGTLRAQGTPEAPVLLLGDNVTGLRAEGGTVRLESADVRAGVRVHRHGTLEAFDSTFRHAAWLSNLGFPCFTRLVRCEIQSQVLSLSGTSVVEDVLVSDPTSLVAIRGFWNVAGLESHAPLLFGAHGQDRVIDRVTVTGASGPALELSATGGAVDFLLGPNNVLSGNPYPAWIRHASLRPESTLPTSGNVNDAILGFHNLAAAMRCRPSLPDLGLPYHFLERGTAEGLLQIAPGARLLFGPEGGLTVTADRGQDPVLRGLPGRPIRLHRLEPGQPWLSLTSIFGLTLFEHLEVDGAGIGVVASQAELLLRDSTISRCALGAQPASDGHIFGSGVRFIENTVGLRNSTTGLASAIGTGIHFDGTERANLFERNLLAAENVPTTLGHHHEFPARDNWWGHPSGPFDALFHPQGQGDPVSWVDYQPHLVGEPDLTDQRPVVRLRTRLHPVVHPGEKIFIEWQAQDDGTIVEFDVQVLSDDVNAPYQTYVDLISNLPGSARRCELVVPDVGLHPYERFPFRIVARDDAGNVGFEQFQLPIAHRKPPGQVTFQTPLLEFRGGEDVEVCFDAVGMDSPFPRVYIETASDDRIEMSAAAVSQGSLQCTFGTVRMPYASTDRARLAVRAEGNWNRDEWYFSDYFTIRPDPRLGDAPPIVQMTSPRAGQAFHGTGVIPIAWTASDDHGLHEFRIQASFNGGHTFHTIIPSLPGDARSYSWKLPHSSGVADLRIRVVAVDTLLQNTSDGDERVLEIRPTPALVSRQPLMR